MEFKPYFQEILNKMEKVKPSVIMELSGCKPENLKYLEEGHYKCKCPFPGHTDRNIGSFDLNDNKLIAKCFACGAGGRPVRFYRDLNGLSSDFEAAICLAMDLGEITPEKATRILHSDSHHSKTILEHKKKVYAENGKTRSPSIKPLEIRDAFYAEMVKNLGLNESDRQYLTAERGIKEDELSNFFSINVESAEKAFAKTRSTLGWDQEQYIGIPGIYESYASKEDAFAHRNPQLRFACPKAKGRHYIGIVIHDCFGKIANLQFRNGNSDGARYIWMSSAFANKDDFPLLANGTNGFAAVDFEPGKGTVCKAIGITEGKFKALAMARSGINTFSIQGVSAWKRAMTELENYFRHHPEQQKFLWLAFDSDQKKNAAVAQALYKFYNELVCQGYRIRILDWDEKFGKGIDDVLANGAGKQIKSVSGKVFIRENILPLLNKSTVS